MISLEALSTLLSIGESELIEELILALFFDKSPRLKQAMPRWRAEIAEQIKATPVLKALAQEFQLFQQMQLLSTADFSRQLPTIMTQLKSMPSPLFSLI